MSDYAKQVKPYSLSAFAKLWWFDGEWERRGRCWIVTRERLPGCQKIPADARPLCSSFSIDLYDRTGNTVLARDVRCSATDRAGYPELLCVAGIWYEQMGGRVLYREGIGWCIEREAARNTKAAMMMNAGFYAWHTPEPWLRPLRWALLRAAYGLRAWWRARRGTV